MGNQPPETYTAKPERFDALSGVSISRDHGCELDASGHGVCWGNDTGGKAQAPAAKTFTAVSASAGSSCGLESNGSVTCWGTESCASRADSPGPYTKMCAAWRGACGIKANGKVECWGCDIGPPPADATFTELACGFMSACG